MPIISHLKKKILFQNDTAALASLQPVSILDFEKKEWYMRYNFAYHASLWFDNTA